MGYLSPVDAAFLRMESPRTPMHVAGLMVFKLPENAAPDYLRQLFEKIRTSPVNTYPFNCVLKKGFFKKALPEWEPAKQIDIDYHVRHSALPYPGGEKELGVLVSRLHSHPIDLTRPLWEFHLIEGLENNRFALYFKAHHCAIDGMGAMKLINRWLSEDPNKKNGYAPWAQTLPRAKRKMRTKPNIVSHSVEILKRQIKSADELAHALQKMTNRHDNPEGGMMSALHTPRSLFNVKITPQRRLATQLYELERFKKIEKATGATVNDICLAILGASIQRYLEEVDALPDKPLIASVPIALPRSEGHSGNAVAGFICPMATEQHDVLQRLNSIHAITSRTKENIRHLSKDALNQFSLLGISPLMIGQMTGLGTFFPPFFNLVVSNVVSSKHKLYLEGAELEATYPVSLLFDGYALNVTIVGYADKLALGFTGDRQAVPSLQRLAVYTGDALVELENAVFNQQDKAESSDKVTAINAV